MNVKISIQDAEGNWNHLTACLSEKDYYKKPIGFYGLTELGEKLITTVATELGIPVPAHPWIVLW